jgi:hypothetical protein
VSFGEGQSCVALRGIGLGGGPAGEGLSEQGHCQLPDRSAGAGVPRSGRMRKYNCFVIRLGLSLVEWNPVLRVWEVGRTRGSCAHAGLGKSESNSFVVA